MTNTKPLTNTKSLLFCVLLLLWLTVPAAHAAPFTSPHGYSLSVPAGWHIKSPSMSGDDADVVVNQQAAVGGQMTTPLFQVQFRPLDVPATAANLAAINHGALATVRQSFPDLKVLSQTSSTLGGVRDLDCVFTATANGLPLRFHEVLVMKNKGALTFTSICPRQVYPRYAAAYAQMLASVHWKS